MAPGNSSSYLLDGAVNGLLTVAVAERNTTAAADFFTPVAMMTAYGIVAQHAPTRAASISKAVATFVAEKYRLEPVNTDICT